MRYCFYIGTSLLLIIIQTTVLPYFSLFNGFYDLLIPFVIFLIICLPLRESLPFILVLGFIMDSLSGSPFGLYLIVYFWLFVSLRWITRYLRVSNKLLLSLFVIGAVLVENVLVTGTLTIFGAGRQFSPQAVKMITLQLLWTVFTGPMFLLALLTIHKRLNNQPNENLS